MTSKIKFYNKWFHSFRTEHRISGLFNQKLKGFGQPKKEKNYFTILNTDTHQNGYINVICFIAGYGTCIVKIDAFSRLFVSITLAEIYFWVSEYLAIDLFSIWLLELEIKSFGIVLHSIENEKLWTQHLFSIFGHPIFVKISKCFKWMKKKKGRNSMLLQWMVVFANKPIINGIFINEPKRFSFWKEGVLFTTTFSLINLYVWNINFYNFDFSHFLRNPQINASLRKDDWIYSHSLSLGLQAIRKCEFKNFFNGSECLCANNIRNWYENSKMKKIAKN